MNDADVPANSRSRRLRWLLIGAAGLVVVVLGAFILYVFVFDDAPAALDTDDLSSALVATVPATSPAATETAAPVATTAPTDSSPSDDATASDFDGDWIPTEASEFGYRVDEVIAGANVTAVGRSNEIDGLLTIDGTTATVVDVEVMVESIRSDDALRDGQFRGRIMSADEFPTATFQLTEPIEFGTIPTGDEQITATAIGELTLRGVTNLVEFDVTAQTTGGRIGVLGAIPVVFADYGIDNPSFGAISVEDEGLVEFVLVFERAT